MKGWLVAAALLLASAARLDAQETWGVATLPGSPAFLAAEVGWKSQSPDRVGLPRELVRVLYGRGLESSEEIARLRAIFQLYERLNDALARVRVDGAIRLRPSDDYRDRLADLFELLGFELQQSKGSVRVRTRRSEAATERRLIFERSGMHLDPVIAEFVSTGTLNLEVPTFSVPLPLPAAHWSAILEYDGAASNVMGRVLTDRAAAMLYCGLTSLDPRTLAWIEQQPELLRRIHGRLSGAFCAFARSLHVVDDRVLVPGGPAYDRLWSEMAAAPPHAAAAFIEGLLSGDGGRLAWFFDAAAQLPASYRRYMLASWEKDEARKRKRIFEVYEWFRTSRAGWQPSRRPFERLASDPLLSILAWRVGQDGWPLGPTSRRFWTSLLRGDVPRSAPDAEDADDFLDAAALLRLTTNERGDGTARQALALAQALLAGEPTFPHSALAAVTGAYPRYPILIRTLERMPGVSGLDMTAAVHRADALTNPGTSRAPYGNLAQFQGLLAIIDRATLAGDVDAPSFVSGLSAIPLDADGRYSAGLAGWFVNVLIPAVRTRVDLPSDIADDASGEAVVAAWMSGLLKGRTQSTFEWEGFRYRVDLASQRFKNLRQVRARQQEPTVDAFVELYSAVNALSRQTAPERAQQVAMTLTGVAERLKSRDVDPVDPDGSFPLSEEFAETVRRLRGARGRSAPGRYEDAREAMLPVIDRVAARLFRALAYAPHLGSPDGVLLLGGDVSPRHDFGIFDTLPSGQASPAWAEAAFGGQAAGSRDWHLRGSLLGLDQALAPIALRETVDATAASTSRLGAVDSVGMLRGSLGFSAATAAWTPDLMAQAAQSASRAAAFVPKLPSDGSLRWEWRYSALEWTAVHEPQLRPALLPLSEAAALTATDEEWEALDRLGGDLLPLTGSWRPRLPPRMPPEFWVGREPAGMLPVWTAELKFRLAAAMHDLRLPSELAAVLAGRLALALAAEVAPADPFDWIIVQRRVLTLSPDAVADLVAGLTADGTLLVTR